MTDEDQEARSLKFEPRGSVTLRRLSTGRYALYPLGGIGTPFWIGPIEQLAGAYEARPAPVPHTPRAEHTKRGTLGIDLSGVEFSL